MSSVRLAVLVLALTLTAGCDRLLVTPTPGPGSRALAITLEPSALQALSRAGAREAFDDADVLRVVLIPLYAYDGGDPFLTGPGRMVDSLMPFSPRDTVRVQLEIDEAALDSLTDVILGIMIKVGPDPLFVFADTIRLDPSHTTRAPIPLLLPVPASVVLAAERDSIAASADSTRVHAVGLFATGDTVPADQFAPEIYTLDSALVSVSDDGSDGRVWPVAAGTARIVAHADLPAGGVAEDTVSIRVVSPAPLAARFQQISLGSGWACGLALDQTVYCWGYNGWGALGTGDQTDSNIPVQALSGFSVASVSAGWDHGCAVYTDQVLRCWGRNDSGQLGVGVISPLQATPGAVGGGPWVSVSAGGDHSCAIDTNSELWCWGSNAFGQLGPGATVGSSIPVPVHVGTELWSQVAVGVHVSCGITTAGVAKCWGLGDEGVLGNGGNSDLNVPTPVSGGPWTRLVPGYSHACGIANGGGLYCWGQNGSNQMGLLTGPDAATHAVPEATGVQVAVTSLVAGAFHSCLVRASDGTYKCWGANGSGQLGDGAAPTSGWSMIDAPINGNFTCALRSADGQAYCWGDNALGQLGNGTLISTSVPVPVTDPCTCPSVSRAPLVRPRSR